ncbi:enzymatic poly [Lasius niger]|uniref:Enzymatic poly n=1 Tax=Lasius niger TaxID=67767 RepID=A0A0J7JU27_LASNI|nr:enzymatic poly [Lasius niger]
MEPQRIRLTSDEPIALRPYRTSEKEQLEIDKQIEQMLKADIIQPSQSNYAAPVTLVYKRDDNTKSRFCVDFRKLNYVLKNDKEPLARIYDILDNLRGAEWFSKIDLKNGYWHIKIHPDDTEKLAFVTKNL